MSVNKSAFFDLLQSNEQKTSSTYVNAEMNLFAT